MSTTAIRTGYIDLTTGVYLADLDNHLFCFDVDQAKINLLKHGGVPIYKPGLKDVIERNMETSRLAFSTEIAAGVTCGSIQFIAVSTPPD